MFSSDILHGASIIVDSWQKYHISMPDGGPVYTETDPSRWLVEPWNAFSSLLYLIPVILWIIKLRGKFRSYPFLLYCLPWLVLGGIGSTLFHAFRHYRFFLFLDFIPMAILTLSISIYFWVKVLPRWWHVLLVIIPTFLFRGLLFRDLPSHTAINVSYAMTGLLIFIPLLLLLIRHAFKEFRSIGLAAVFLSLSLFFREMDAWEHLVLPMGTHFLWHLFSALGAWFLASYLFYLRNTELEAKS
jgi:hypothetical protein